MTQQQLDDFATILARQLAREEIILLAQDVLGSDDAYLNAKDQIDDREKFARAMVTAMHADGRAEEAVSLLLRDATPRGKLAVLLQYIKRGGTLSDKEMLQAFENDIEPFLSTAEFLSNFPRVARTVCAIGLGDPVYNITGTGFLVGPDLVLTNAHVVQNYLNFDGATIAANGPGSQIYCFFDYVAEPRPQVPPRAGTKCVVVTATEKDWLEDASDLLADEGTPLAPATNGHRCFDYALIRLSKKIGNLPARAGGGTPRGWLSFPQAVDVLTEHQRIIVYQHPERAPQAFDIGEFRGRDATKTRVRYTVNTAHGSSGGAAVDSKGQLFALHSAGLDKLVDGKKLNQGVQINLIAEQLLENVPELKNLPPPDARPFWSLSDKESDPQPVIGRDAFRDAVLALHGDPKKNSPPKVIAVWGPEGCGLRYTTKLLRRLIGRETRFAEFSADKLQLYKEADAFVNDVAKQLALPGRLDHPVPAQTSTEALSRWLRNDLPRWLAARLEDGAKDEPHRFPAWLVLHTAVANFRWPDQLEEVVAAIAGARDRGQPGIDMPHLRVLFLGSNSDSVPAMAGVEQIDDDLTTYGTYAAEFADCVSRALYSLDRESEIALQPWAAIANFIVRSVPASNSRKLLSNGVPRDRAGNARRKGSAMSSEPEIPDWMRTAFAKAAESVSSPSVRAHHGGAAWPLFVEAAMLPNFVPKELQPGVLEGDVRKEAEKELLRFAEITESDNEVRWSLTGTARREVLETCEAGELLHASADTRSVDPVKSALHELVSHRGAVDVSSIATRDLDAMRIATTWLSGAKMELPPLAEIDRELELRSLLAPFERMTGKRGGGDRFFGRADEIEKLRAYVGVVPATRFSHRLTRAAHAVVNFITGNHAPMSVWGTGGVGKTTLIAVFMLEHARAAASKFPFVYLDFDRSTISASNRAALLMEMCRQVGAQFSELMQPMAALRERIAPIARATGRNAESDEISRLIPHLAEFRLLVDRTLAGEPFLLVFDTFELVQYGPDQVAALDELVRELGTSAEGWPRLRLVISGRAHVKEFAGARTQELELGALDYDGSVAMLEALANDAGKPVTRKEAERLITAVVKIVRDRSNDGVRPLRLRLLGELFSRAQGAGATLVQSLIDEFTNPKSGKKQAGELLFNGIVVRRTIGHVRDPEVAALADPGLVVRRITKDVIRHVMTRGTPKPAGVDPGDPDTYEPWIVDDLQAQKIFDAFAKEVSLVEREGDALKHRQDVRQDMLPLIRGQRPRAFERIHRLAFEHFLGKVNGEAVYHGLWLGEDLDELDKLWPATDPLIDENEFDPGSPQEIYLRVKRRKDVTAEEMRKLPANIGLSWLWERKDDLVAELRVGNYVEMIRAIGGDKFHVFDGREELAAVAARVLYRAGMWRDALSLSRRHFSPLFDVRREPAQSLFRTWATTVAKLKESPERYVADTFTDEISDLVVRTEVLAHLQLAGSRRMEEALAETVGRVRPSQWRRNMRVLRLAIATGVVGTEKLLPHYVEGTRQLPRDWSVADILSRIRGRETKLDDIDRIWAEEKDRYLESRETTRALRALAAADHSDWMVPFGNALTRGLETDAREIGKLARGVAGKADNVSRALAARDGHSLLQALVTHGLLLRFAEQLAQPAAPETAPGMAKLLIDWHRQTVPETLKP